jgi:hypothetical protein
VAGAGTWGSRSCMSRVHAIVWVQLVPFACRTCQWVSTVATAALDWPPKQAHHLLFAPAEMSVEDRTGAVTAFLRVSQA